MVFSGDLHEAVFHFVEELTSVVVPSLLQSLPSQFVDHSRDRGLGSGSPVGDVLDKACSTSLNHFDFFHLVTMVRVPDGGAVLFGRTVVLYAFSLSCPEHLRIALLRKPNILLAALLLLSICWFP